MAKKELPEGFGRKFRLIRSAEFRSFDRGAKRIVFRHLIFLYKPSAVAEVPRLGITISGKYGGATHRNRLKRRIREFFRKNKDCFLGLDMLLIARSPKRKADSKLYDSEIDADFIAIMEKLRKR